jgi:hypothetical protein
MIDDLWYKNGVIYRRAVERSTRGDIAMPLSALLQHSSLRAQRSNPESLRGGSLDCFVARAPRNDAEIAVATS